MQLHFPLSRSLICAAKGRHHHRLLHFQRVSLSSVRPSLFPATTRRCRLLRTLAPFAPRSMAAAADNPSVISADDEAKFGFQRAEMYKGTLANTVDPPYDRHVFLCYKGPESWTPKVEDADTEMLPKLLGVALKARKNDIPVKTRLTICGGCSGIECSDGDVLIFPDMIKYKGLTESGVDSFVEDVLVNGKPWASGVPEAFTGSHVFVCAHGSRDRRCGVCGPPLIEKLNEEIELRGLKDQVFVSPCSHIGGHKYAGNLIVFSPDSAGTITGHWYGYVTPDDVPEVLEQHIGQGKVIERLWRGQMGASAGEGQKADKQKLPNGTDHKKSRKHEESIVQEQKEAVSGCCQGVNGFSCCRDGSLDQSSASEEKKQKGSCPGWVGKWEQSEVLTAAAIVGAVATIAVAYSFYRRSS
ncbi:altered inheritance of mitochondria protein 32 [Rhodamnia argentea]|uniref:Altered inheritance of mitochondria protein 32 n=1 Tax=Rhodamnia argentea TaxID=178133 RepID=A0A8B8QF28_9MYRT|nr:altered inheritance of mitochondria protein 32 [Rhodamnia argentea]